MAIAAWRFEVEKTMEQRLERLEVHVEHIQADVIEVKGKLWEIDLRLTAQIKEVDQRLSGKIEEVEKRLTGKIEDLDKRLTGKIEDLDKKLTGKIDEVLKAIGDLRVGRFIDRVWFLLMTAAVLWVMAKAFKWI